jgi:cation transport ATPase
MFLSPFDCDFLLLTSLTIAALPLCAEFAYKLAHRNFSVDILEFLCVVSAMLLRQYWAAAIVILIFSGGKVLKQYANRRASSGLCALSRRMLQIVHCVPQDGSTADIPAESKRPERP